MRKSGKSEWESLKCKSLSLTEVKKGAVTMSRLIRILCPLILTCLVLLLVVGCTQSPTAPPIPEEPPTSDTSTAPVDRVEVVYFHRTSRCSGCIYAEEATRYTVETYFKDELANGKLNLEVLDVEDKENAVIVDKYGAFTSSLFVNTIRGGTGHIEEVEEIWFVLGKDEAFVEVVKSKIEKSLKGEE